MAGNTPRLPEQFEAEQHGENFDVSELLSEAAGSHSPFGDIEFPVPYETLSYVHPSPESRPRMADGR